MFTSNHRICTYGIRTQNLAFQAGDETDDFKMDNRVRWILTAHIFDKKETMYAPLAENLAKDLYDNPPSDSFRKNVCAGIQAHKKRWGRVKIREELVWKQTPAWLDLMLLMLIKKRAATAQTYRSRTSLTDPVVYVFWVTNALTSPYFVLLRLT